MDEKFDVLDSSGNSTGEIKPRSLVHKDGNWHRSVFIFVISDAGLLIQKRSQNKESYPDLWDVSCAGHVSAGESSVEAAVKELREELGLNVSGNDLAMISSVRDQDILEDGAFINNEIIDLYLVKTDSDLSKFKLQSEEVSEIKWLRLDELKVLIKHEPKDFVPNWEAFSLLLEFLSRTDR